MNNLFFRSDIIIFMCVFWAQSSGQQIQIYLKHIIIINSRCYVICDASFLIRPRETSVSYFNGNNNYNQYLLKMF